MLMLKMLLSPITTRVARRGRRSAVLHTQYSRPFTCSISSISGVFDSERPSQTGMGRSTCEST